jgi:hypothetical protein
MKKVLPAYFAIKTDTKHPLWEEYISYLNNILKERGSNNTFSGDVGAYYGIDGGLGGDAGTNCVVKFKHFYRHERVQLITLEEWKELTTPNNKKFPPNTYVKCDDPETQNQIVFDYLISSGHNKGGWDGGGVNGHYGVDSNNDIYYASDYRVCAPESKPTVITFKTFEKEYLNKPEKQ